MSRSIRHRHRAEVPGSRREPLLSERRQRRRPGSMSSFEKGANVWYHHPQETWIPTVVLTGSSEEITVKTEDGEGENDHGHRTGRQALVESGG